MRIYHWLPAFWYTYFCNNRDTIDVQKLRKLIWFYHVPGIEQLSWHPRFKLHILKIKMTLHPYDNSYHRYFNMYEKNGTRIYELGCINCPPLKCVCTKREIIGAKIPYTVRISGNFKRIAILNLEPAFLTPINIGKFKTCHRIPQYTPVWAYFVYVN